MVRDHFVATVALVFLAVCPQTSKADPSMLGDTVELWHHPQSTGVESLLDSFEVVNPGSEYVSGANLYSLQLNDTTILLHAENYFYSPIFNSGHDPSYISLRDIEVPGSPELYIGSVDVQFSSGIDVHEDTPLPWPNFSDANVTFGDHEVTFLWGGYEFPEGSNVLVTLHFVPEPGSVALLGAGCLSAAMWWRRRGTSPVAA